MRCPQCGTRNPLGSERCSNCGREFTRSKPVQSPRPATQAGAAGDDTAYIPSDRARQRRPDVHVHVREDEYGYDDEPYEREAAYREPAPRWGGFRCLTVLAALLVVVLLAVIALILAANLLIKPRIEDAVADNVGSGIETAVSEQVSASIPDVPAGEITITEADINQRIAAQNNLGPVSNLNVGITPDGVEADLDAYGLSGSYSADVAAENGQIQLTNSDVSGPLQYLVPEGQIEQIAADAINRALAGAGYRVEGVTLQDGALVLSLAR